jgi:predicted ATPase
MRIKTERFRAINQADIILDGITLVAGVNGCGKSTLSKLLYYVYKTAVNYDLLVNKSLTIKLREIHRLVEMLLMDLKFEKRTKIKDNRDIRYEWHELGRSKLNTNTDSHDKWLQLLNQIKEIYSDQSEKTLFDSPLSKRFKYILADVLKRQMFDSDKDETIPFEAINTHIESIFKEAFGKIESRPISLFDQELQQVFASSAAPQNLEVLELDTHILAHNKQHVSRPYIVENVVYIDTPMMIGVQDQNYSHWEDLNLLLSKRAIASDTETLNSNISIIINGEVSRSEDSIARDQFLYYQAGGSVFNLLDCATGIKSFSIIQLLLKNGSLNNKTLLIIDEPELNLHPQWIVEYARLIVLLNKKVGIKFFLASHNPDMVSAIKYIAEKEGVGDKLNFYLAEPSGDNRTFDYKHLGTEIDPIFASFNIALERITKYGSAEA